jgi:dTMP kinase
VTFEGIEGSGKSTQAERLYKWLTLQGYDCVFTREPGGTKISGKIREVLLDNENKALCGLAELFLYLADRAQDVDEIIKPALSTGKIVIADRFFDSTIAYQGKGRGISQQSIEDLNIVATQGIKPDLTVLVDISPGIGLARLQHKDRMESEPDDFHHRVRTKYLEIADRDPDRVKVLDGTLSVDEIEKQVRELVQSLLHQQERQNSRSDIPA